MIAAGSRPRIAGLSRLVYDQLDILVVELEQHRLHGKIDKKFCVNYIFFELDLAGFKS